MSDELKPCPFCGKDIYIEFPRDSEEFDGHCTNKNCFLYGRNFLFVDVDKWNTRPIEDALEAENAKLRALLAKWLEAECITGWYRLDARLYDVINQTRAVLGTDFNNH